MRGETGNGRRFAAFREWLVRVGLALLAPSMALLVLAISGSIQVERFAIGQGSGLRVIASIAVLGCLLTAIGYWDQK